MAIQEANITTTKYSPAFPPARPPSKKESREAKFKAKEALLSKRANARCMRDYGMSCDRLESWKSDADADCQKKGKGQQCKDSNYIDTKYRPRTLQEKQR